MKKDNRKPVIETLINTSALALTSFGVLQITQGSMKGYLALGIGMFLEFIKYYGRSKLNLW